MNCKQATESYETWLAKRTRIIKADLLLKHQQLGKAKAKRMIFSRNLMGYGAEGGTRTPTSYLTRPSNVRVYQFRHFGSFGKVVKQSLGA